MGKESRSEYVHPCSSQNCVVRPSVEGQCSVSCTLVHFKTLETSRDKKKHVCDNHATTPKTHPNKMVHIKFERPSRPSSHINHIKSLQPIYPTTSGPASSLSTHPARMPSQKSLPGAGRMNFCERRYSTMKASRSVTDWCRRKASKETFT